MKHIYWFEELSKDSLPIAGGKGANLGEMIRAGFPIPPGFVVSADSYYEYITKYGIDKLIIETLKNLDVEDTAKLNEASKKISNAILSYEMPEEIANQIIEAYSQLKNRTGSKIEYVAVRSSATAEDVPSIAAGEHVLVDINGNLVYDTIENIYEKFGHLGSILKVPSLEFGTGNIVWSQIDSIYRHPINSKLYLIRTESGKEIIVSEKHSLIKLDKKTISPILSSVSDLTVYDYLPTARRLEIRNVNPKCSDVDSPKSKYLDVRLYLNEEDVVEEKGELRVLNNSTNYSIQNGLPRRIELSEDFAYFLGLFVAEGSTYKNNHVIITNSDKQILDSALKFLKSIGIYHNQKINKHSIRVYCKALVRLLHKLCGVPIEKKGKGKSCRIKRIPNFVADTDKKFIQAFLKGCFDGDGSIQNSGVKYYSTSKFVIGGISKLLEILEFRYYLSTKKSHRGVVYSIALPISESAKFKELIGTSSETKQKKLDALIHSYSKRKLFTHFKSTILLSDRMQTVRKNILFQLPKEQVVKVKCPLCKNFINRSSYYKQKVRYYCEDCKKTFYSGEVLYSDTEIYKNYNEQGRFIKGSVPWNKGLVSKKLNPYKVKNLIVKYGEENVKDITSLFDGNVKWERVIKIEPVDYKGYVYDFVVPETQNFLAGFGGIITHNTASFAGQQASFLNVYGEQALIDAVKRCWASLFTPRAIYYRVQQGFEHSKVKIAVVVQHMVQSEKSGVFFTVDPVSQDPNKMVIEAAFGLGETVVSGAVTPDTYIINKSTLDIIHKHIAKQEWMLIKSENANVKLGIKAEYQSMQKLEDEKIIELAKIGREIEKHYKWPQDIEWASEGGKLYIVQSRPITTLKKEVTERFVREMEQKEVENIEEYPSVRSEEKVETMETETKVEKGSIILKGLPASPGFAIGKVRVILDISDLPSMQPGEVLVTKMTTPDFVPAMRKASAIITDEGGLTSHAAIVSRELGVPAVIGTEKATSILKNEMLVTVDANKGIIYRGKVDLTEVPKQPASISGEILPVTATKIYVNLAEPDMAEKVAKLSVDGVGLLRAEFMIASIGEHPKKMLKEGREQEFIDKLADGIAKIAGAFYPRPVVYRATDFKTNEYRNLKGGEEFEPKEENPMMGYRGAMRYIKEPELFKMELKAIKKVREEFQLKNVWLMIPFVRRSEQIIKIKKIMEEEGLHQSKDFKLWIMVEVPSTVFMIEEICQTGIDGISIGSNDLTQLILGVDRDNSSIAFEFDERSTAVLRAIQYVIKVCRKYGVTTSICGQAPSVYPEIAEKLVEFGTTSISVNPDAIERTRKIVAAAEQKVLLERTRKILEKIGIEDEQVKHTKT